MGAPIRGIDIKVTVMYTNLALDHLAGMANKLRFFLGDIQIRIAKTRSSIPPSPRSL